MYYLKGHFDNLNIEWLTTPCWLIYPKSLTYRFDQIKLQIRAEKIIKI